MTAYAPKPNEAPWVSLYLFWGDRMCQLKDPYGYVWCVATRGENHLQ